MRESYFSLSSSILKAAFGCLGEENIRAVNSGSGDREEMLFSFQDFALHLKFSKWVLSRAILNILGILGGQARPGSAVLHLVFFFQTMVVLLYLNANCFSVL